MMRVERSRVTARRGFTLIELLTVIAVILLLMGLLMPAYRTARKQARRTQAITEVKQIEMAWRSLYNDYRLFPSVAITIMNKAACDHLTASDASFNRRRIPYLELPPGQTNSFCDPFEIDRSPKLAVAYGVSLDNGLGSDVTAYDNVVDTPYGQVNGPVAVWSVGASPDVKPVYSWQL